MPEVGDSAPDIELQSSEGSVRPVELSRERPVVLAFYQEDNTPTCSSQISALKGDYELFQELRANVVAVSADSVDSHRSFGERLGGVPFTLASDEDLSAAAAYGVIDDSGKRSRRAVFVIEDGVIRLALPWFNPSNSEQYQQIFEALGFKT